MPTAIINVRIIDGTGAAPIESGAVIIDDNRITSVGSSNSVSIPDVATVIDGRGMTLMPGLIDAHVHLVSTGSPDRLARIQTSIPQATLNALAHAQKALNAGFTALRDAGAPGGSVIAVRNSINSGLVPGPRIRASGSGLTITGGHGDPQNGFPREIIFAHRRVVDSPEEAIRAAREELRDGADCIKLIATGGVLSAGTDNRSLGMPYEDMAAAIREAHNRGKRTLAHAQATEGIKNAIRAGIDSIEHGFWFDDEAVELLLERGTYLVPTLVAARQILVKGTSAGIPEFAVRKVELGHEAHIRSLQRVYQAGGKIAMGTDAGTPFNYHGANAHELTLMVEAGMSPMDVIIAATRNGADLLDIDAGVLAEGKLADLILVNGDPLSDITCLEAAENVKLVVKDGKIEKNLL